ncbi:hypothetical protein A9Q98_13415 [Thalassotalea sp. 42_200_T64]|nr:hypothetical protein A9Q98_13415 [Thalassotalea sp. 42_200_T64]
MKYFAIVFISLLLLACASKDVEKPSLTVTQSRTLEAQVVSIDHESRIVALLRADGETISLMVDSRVTNLNQVKIGDTIEAEYKETITLSVQQSDGTAPVVIQETQRNMNDEGGEPGVVTTSTIIATADVVDINYEESWLTLRGPDNINRRFPVVQQSESFNAIKKGDQVVLDFTTALAISVNHKPFTQETPNPKNKL